MHNIQAVQKINRINEVRRQVLFYYDEYTRQTDTPTLNGYLEYAEAQEELDNELMAREKLATEESLRRDL